MAMEVVDRKNIGNLRTDPRFGALNLAGAVLEERYTASEPAPRKERRGGLFPRATPL